MVRQEGMREVKRKIEHYNLDAIISAGYRVKSRQGTQFRIWANRILKDYPVQGYTLNQPLNRSSGARALSRSPVLLVRLCRTRQH